MRFSHRKNELDLIESALPLNKLHRKLSQINWKTCTMQNILGFVVFYTQRDTYSEYIYM